MMTWIAEGNPRRLDLSLSRILEPGITWALLGYFAFQLTKYEWLNIQNPFPAEYREGAMLLTTSLLQAGKNPYSPSNQPVFINVYGLLYNLIVLPFANIFGNSFAIHRITTGIFIVLSGLVVGFVVYRIVHKAAVAVAAGLLSIAGLLFSVTAFARPDSLGTLLFLAALAWPWIRRYDRASLGASIILSVMAFSAKPYFMLSILVIAAYLFLFVSKKTAIIYGVISTGVFVLTTAILNGLFPFYFQNVLFSHTEGTMWNLKHLLTQLLLFGIIYFFIIAFMIFHQVESAKHARRFRFAGVDFSFNGFHLAQPACHPPINYWTFAILCTGAAFLLLLGWHAGNFMVYMFQLISPLLLIVAANTFNWISFPRRIFSFGAFFAALVIFPSYILVVNFPADYARQWREAYGYIGQSKEVFAGPPFAAEILAEGKNVYDSGQTEYFFSVRVGQSPLLPAPQVQEETGNGYLANINQMTREGKFDNILNTKDISPLLSPALIQQSYHLVAEKQVEMPFARQKWIYQVWVSASTPK